MIKVNFSYSTNPYIIKRTLDELPEIIACDFETSSKLDDKDLALVKYRLTNQKRSNLANRQLLQMYQANGLSHPALTVITHLSIAWSDRDAFVAVLDRETNRRIIYKFLTETSRLQIWHNASFDWRHIYYHTGLMPKCYLDTQLLAKCILNNANSTKDRTDLKGLMAVEYGAWALAKDSFTLENQHDPKMIEYAATDACATYKLYEQICEETHIEIISDGQNVTYRETS